MISLQTLYSPIATFNTYNSLSSFSLPKMTKFIKAKLGNEKNLLLKKYREINIEKYEAKIYINLSQIACSQYA